MIGLLEVVLFLAPFAGFALWRLAGPLMPPMMLWVAIAAVAVLAATVVWYMRETRFAKGVRYVPSHIEDGRIVPAHAAP
jgi:hypothetical protein